MRVPRCEGWLLDRDKRHFLDNARLIFEGVSPFEPASVRPERYVGRYDLQTLCHAVIPDKERVDAPAVGTDEAISLFLSQSLEGGQRGTVVEARRVLLDPVERRFVGNREGKVRPQTSVVLDHNHPERNTRQIFPEPVVITVDVNR